MTPEFSPDGTEYVLIENMANETFDFKRPVVYRPDGTVYAVNGKRNLETYQAAVEGYIEPVRVPNFNANSVDEFVGLVNEEGLLKGLPYNATASLICGQPIVGNLLILKEEWFD
jgi:hypothetical protein